MKKINLAPVIGHPSSQIWFDQKILENDQFIDFCKNRTNRLVIITDGTVQSLYAEKLANRLSAKLLTIAPGEQSKTAQTAEQIEQELFTSHYGKDTTLIAMGGGVVTDLVGFVASIYMRGIDCILIPTTLLAMVDAAIGGKTAINTSFGKNLIGTTYFPRGIVIDPDTLKTLPDKELFNGLAEIRKIALVSNASLVPFKKNKIHENLIIAAIQSKIDIIEKDPLEKGLRRILNFGHTIGHALEHISNYEISHGEAVAIGCLVESHLSKDLGYLPQSQFDDLQQFFLSDSLKLPHTYDRKILIEAMMRDKKNLNQLIRFVLIDRIGHALACDGAYCRAVNPEELTTTLEWMETMYG